MNRSLKHQLFGAKLSSMTGGISAQRMEDILYLIDVIEELKKEKKAVVLSHYYMPPELQITTEFGGVADFVGDSLGLSLEARKRDAEVIVFCGVKFMAETAAIINTDKKVLLPDMGAGCSLASSITGENVKKLRDKYPGIPVMGYINTYAETKAECDIICTSRNALAIAKSFKSDKIIFVPDMHMGNNLAARFKDEIKKDLILWNGTCEVHDQFRNNIQEMAIANPGAEMLLHWEVPDFSVRSALEKNQGIVGSTSDIIQYVGQSKSRQFILGSECDLGASLKGLYPEKEFITPCLMCRFMKKINLENTLATLQSIGEKEEAEYSITVSKSISERARIPLMRMLEFTN